MTLINERDAASAPAACAQAAIELRGVTKTFGDGSNEIVALADVDPWMRIIGLIVTVPIVVASGAALAAATTTACATSSPSELTV